MRTLRRESKTFGGESSDSKRSKRENGKGRATKVYYFVNGPGSSFRARRPSEKAVAMVKDCPAADWRPSLTRRTLAHPAAVHMLTTDHLNTAPAGMNVGTRR